MEKMSPVSIYLYIALYLAAVGWACRLIWNEIVVNLVNGAESITSLEGYLLSAAMMVFIAHATRKRNPTTLK